ncbi:flagellar hook-length control protein FliK [Methyloversatilis discipulorum]|uniref:flagellar hook-length control protein FliK n=1 Tax=Methyloversatilis discipulorum TaxID=1119528 RepID=UPI001A3C998A|nr:flagellar hook-length control protein FliK [Methyloversatilis discipulorum]MBL8468804.1 flagellar hook-length control protein FliK [Methyloversatilis discipulorum]
MNNLLPGLAQRLAALTRESVQTTGPIAALSDQLPEFEPGERYTARILQNLRDGLARADVGGQTVTLRLTQTVPEGRTVSLTHVSRSAQTLVAALDGDNAAPTDGDVPADDAGSPVRLSVPARTIASLLEGPEPQPTRLASGKPMIDPAAMANAATGTLESDATPQIASRLAQAIGTSGLFYESHQAQWVSGERPLESTAAEPQRTFDPEKPASRTSPTTGQAVAADDVPELAQMPNNAGSPRTDDESIRDTASLRSDTGVRERTEAAKADSGPPAELRPLVQNQLLGLSQHTLAWEGLAWPGQTMKIEIDDPEPQRQGEPGSEGDSAPEVPWTSRVRLVLPGLGEVETSLTLWKDHGLTLAISADDGARLRMGTALLDLQQRMTDAGLRLGSVNFSELDETSGSPPTGGKESVS